MTKALGSRSPARFASECFLNYRGLEKREEIQAQHSDVNWNIAMMPGKRRTLDKVTLIGAVQEKLEQAQVSTCAKMAHQFRVNKLQFDCGVKVKIGVWPKKRPTWSRCSRCRNCGWRATADEDRGTGMEYARNGSIGCDQGLITLER